MNKKEDVIVNLGKMINNIKNAEKHYDLFSIFNSMDKESLAYESIINYYLKKFKKEYSLKDITKLESLVAEKTKYFDYSNQAKSDEQARYYYMICEEANIITFDLINKVFGKNNRNLDLPVDILEIIDYSISSFIKKEDVDKVIYWIILELAIIDVYI